MEVEGCGRLSVHDGLLDVAWCCVCKLVGSLAGDECKLGDGWLKFKCVGRQTGSGSWVGGAMYVI